MFSSGFQWKNWVENWDVIIIREQTLVVRAFKSAQNTRPRVWVVGNDTSRPTFECIANEFPSWKQFTYVLKLENLGI